MDGDTGHPGDMLTSTNALASCIPIWEMGIDRPTCWEGPREDDKHGRGFVMEGVLWLRG